MLRLFFACTYTRSAFRCLFSRRTCVASGSPGGRFSRGFAAAGVLELVPLVLVLTKGRRLDAAEPRA